MRPIDTLFILLLFSSYLNNSKKKYFISILPILAFTLSLSNAYIPPSIASFVLPAMAILACIICIELAPLSLLLLFSDYTHFWEVLMIPFIWFLVTALLKNLNTRIDEESIPSDIRGFPIRLISLGILYHIIYPLIYL